jgi:hypothetical protein
MLIALNFISTRAVQYGKDTVLSHRNDFQAGEATLPIVATTLTNIKWVVQGT